MRENIELGERSIQGEHYLFEKGLSYDDHIWIVVMFTYRALMHTYRALMFHYKVPGNHALDKVK